MDAIGTTRSGEAKDNDTMLLFGGAACLLFGAGLVLSSPAHPPIPGRCRRGQPAAAAVPDVQRYLKLRAM